MSEKQVIDHLMQTWCAEKEAEEIYDFYLSIDCVESLESLALAKKIIKI